MEEFGSSKHRLYSMELNSKAKPCANYTVLSSSEWGLTPCTAHCWGSIGEVTALSTEADAKLSRVTAESHSCKGIHSLSCVLRAKPTAGSGIG